VPMTDSKWDPATEDEIAAVDAGHPSRPDQIDSEPLRLVGAAGVGEWLDVSTQAVALYRARYANTPHPFPAPDIEISTAVENVYIPGWRPDRKPEFVAWKKSLPGLGWRKDRKANDHA
jgi:hypothetical protein